MNQYAIAALILTALVSFVAGSVFGYYGRKREPRGPVMIGRDTTHFRG